MGGGQSKLLATLDGFNYLETFEVSKSSTENKKGFTLAEDATHVAMQDNSRRVAFTLAEVLITLGIIGVVAAMTIPILVAEITEYTNSHKQVNIAQKITQAMELMKVHGELGRFNSTDDFADTLQKYLKTAKRCDSSHIADCWPTKTVRNSADKVFDVSTATTGDKLGFKLRGNDNNVGLVLADGTPIIMSYDTSSKGYEQMDITKGTSISLPIGGGKSKTFDGYTTTVTSGLAFVMDVNGKSVPNSETIDGKYNDIRSFNGAHFGTDAGSSCLGVKVNKTCVYQLASYEPENCTEAYASEYCVAPSGEIFDYWAGARKACAEINMALPSTSNLLGIANAEWEGKPESGIYWTNTQSDWFGNRNIYSEYVNFSTKSSSRNNRTATYGVICIGSQQ